MPTSFHQQPSQHPYNPYDVAVAALEFLGDQWGALPGPWGLTGHLHSGDWVPFTIGVCEVGDLYIRNDSQGDARHLPGSSTDDVATLGRAVAEVIGELY